MSGGRGRNYPEPKEQSLTIEFTRLEMKNKFCIDSDEKLILFRFSFVLENFFHDLNAHHVEDAIFV